MKSPTFQTDSVVDFEKRSSRFRGGPLMISLMIHGGLVALGLVWIFKIVPEVPEKSVVFTSMDPGESTTPALKRLTKPAAAPNLTRVAARDMVNDLVLPLPDEGESGQGFAGLSGVGSSVSQPFAVTASLGGQTFRSSGSCTAEFFDVPIKAQRIVYVLDFSMTMKGERDTLMRRELGKSLAALPATTEFSVICFSGPVWLPGDEVNNGVVKSGGKIYEWQSVSLWEWKARPPLIKAPWIKASRSEIARTMALVDEVKSAGGTDWEGPLQVAISMEPPPQAVFFMTDGVMEQRDMMRLSRGIAAKAKASGVAINTVAMMEPGAEAPMADLARRTGGKFTVVESDGKVRQPVAR